MKSPKITVLMSVYNGEKYIKEAIDSILNQTFKDFEFLIINDSSSDRTVEILQSYQDSRIKIINNERNIGLTKSLNKGLKLARGEYIARQDADDMSLPERLEKQVAFLNKNKNIGLVGSYYLRMNGNGKALQVVKTISESKELKEKLISGNKFSHGSVMFRKECIEKVGLYREEFKFAQDFDLWLRIADFFDLSNIPEVLYKLRVDAGSISVEKKVKQDKYASLAIKITKERKQFGKDRIKRFRKSGFDGVFKKLETQSISRAEISYGYYFWAKILLDGNDCRGALRLSLKSFSKRPLYRPTLELIFKIFIILLFPKSIVNMVKLIKRTILPWKNK